MHTLPQTLRLVVARDLPERVHDFADPGWYLTVHDDLCVGRHHEILAPGGRRGEPQRFSHERANSGIVVAIVGGEGQCAQVERRGMSTDEDGRSSLTSLLVPVQHPLQMG